MYQHYGYYAGRDIANRCAEADKKIALYAAKLADAEAKLADKSLRAGPIKKTDAQLEREINRHKADLSKWETKRRILECDTATVNGGGGFDPFSMPVPQTISLPQLPESSTPSWLLPVLGAGVFGLFAFALLGGKKRKKR